MSFLLVEFGVPDDDLVKRKRSLVDLQLFYGHSYGTPMTHRAALSCDQPAQATQFQQDRTRSEISFDNFGTRIRNHPSELFLMIQLEVSWKLQTLL